MPRLCRPLAGDSTAQTSNWQVVVEIDQYYINFQPDSTDAEDSYNYSTKLLTQLQDQD
jgi:hypothetical protein